MKRKTPKILSQILTGEPIPDEYKEYNGHRPVKMFPDIYNISDCMVHSHPQYHPDSIQYQRYWYEQEKRCIEGFWFQDTDGVNGGWRYMTPQLYFYINYCVIEDEGTHGQATNEIIHPKLRDVDWMIAYAWFTARRFSGFEDDEEYTCHRIVKKIENGEKLTPKEKFTLEKNEEGKLNIYKPDGTFKKYVDAKHYLYKTHDKPLGLPLYENEAKNLFILGARGWGKSYLAAELVIGHEFNFSGQTRMGQLPQPETIFVGAAIQDKSSELLSKFSQERLKDDYGCHGNNDDFIPGYFYLQTQGSLKPNNADSPFRNEYEYREGNTKKIGGTGTKIIHKTYTVENPQAAVGNRCPVMVIEEVGLLENLLAVHGANETCQIRRTKFGSSLYIGTGGNMEKVVESKIVFEDPDKYNFIDFPDLWESRSGGIGFFLPAYYVDNDFKDPKGNTDLERAFAEEVFQRKQRELASTSVALDSYMMARPIVPSEMFLSTNANVFPVAKLRERDAEMDIKKIFEKVASIGTLEWTTASKNEVRWVENTKQTRLQKPIRLLNLDSYRGDLDSSIVIYEHPVENIPAPSYRKSLYKVVYDPVRDDKGGTSLASILVYKGYTDKDWNQGIQDGIVAEWIGRLDQVDDIHEIAVKLSYYFNSFVLFENNLPGFKNYCKHNKFLHKLMLNPHEAISKAVLNPTRKYDYGIPMTAPGLHIHAEQLIRQWLLEPWKYDESDRERLNLHKLCSPRLIKELISYEHDNKGAFDHVSAFKILMLWLSNEKEGLIFSEKHEQDKYNQINNYSKSIVKNMTFKKKNPWFNY
jgi:hypothetical protein